MKLPTFFTFFIISSYLLIFSGCAFKRISRSKNITYQQTDSSNKNNKLELSVFAPGKLGDLNEVLIFIHGGSWNSGKKSLYNFFGSRMARKDVVVVTIDYPLSPKANYHQMAVAVAKAVEWVKKNIETFGGNPEKIFISGHSAGGHLAALVALRNQYFDSLGMSSPIKGIILIDAAGLDMFGYLQEEKFPEDHTYLKTFTKNPISWKDASPLYHLRHNMPPMLIYRGEKTYPSIFKSHQKLIQALKEYAPDTEYHVLKGKKHVQMITQFFKPWNPRYKEIIMFMKRSD
jgi:acetyl esterase/lipase